MYYRLAKRQERRKRGACIDPNGYDAGKSRQPSGCARQPSGCAEIKGKKRHILVETQGLLMAALGHPADIQDRDGGLLLLATLFGLYPFLRRLFADSGYRGPVFEKGTAKLFKELKVEIVKRSDKATGFVLLPRRWIVERTLAWLNRCRRLAKDWENITRNALAFLQWASIRLMIRKICNH